MTYDHAREAIQMAYDFGDIDEAEYQSAIIDLDEQDCEKDEYEPMI